MPRLTDFLPDDAALWLDRRIRGWHALRIDGPSGSGKTTLLAALAAEIDNAKRIAGLAEDRVEPTYLAEAERKFVMIMPALQVRGSLKSLTDLLNDQMAGIAVSDEPSSETVALLRDVSLSGITVWVTTSSEINFDGNLYVRLGGDPRHRVELIVCEGEPVYWIYNGRSQFRPPPD